MATRWRVAGQTDMTSANTWSTARYNAGSSGAPATTDSLFILDGSGTLTDSSAALDVDLTDLVIGGTFDGNIGTASAPIVVGIDGTLTIANNVVKNIYIGASSTHGVANVVIDAPNANVFLTTTDGGTFARVTVKSCAYLDPAGKITNLHYVGGRMPTIPYSATAISLLTSSGGTYECKRSVTNMSLDAKAMVSTIKTSDGTPAITTANLNGGSVLNHQSSGTIDTLNMYQGKLSPVGAGEDFTVTTLNQYGDPRNTKVYTKAGSVNVTIGTYNDYTGVGESDASQMASITP